MNNDELMLAKSRAALDKLQVAFYAAEQNPNTKFDDLLDMRDAYRVGVNAHAALDARLMRLGILTSNEQLAEIDRINADMDSALDTRARLEVLARLLKLLPTIA